MGVFQYKALDDQRKSIRGTVAADTPRQARDALRARGLQVVSVGDAKSSPRQWSTQWARGRFASRWAICVHELSMLLGAGVPLLDALDTVIDQHGRQSAVLLNVRDQVAAGSSLGDALRQREDLFDPLSIHLVEVGENTGNLDVVLEQLAEFQRRFRQLKDRVFTALMYPMFLVVFTTVATVFLMTYVMPALLENLQETVEQLPWPTRVVKGASDTLIHNAWWLAIAVPFVCVILVGLLQTNTGRRTWHGLLLKVPVIGSMALKQSISRIALIISTLTRSGIELTQALDLAARSSDNSLLRSALEDCSQLVSAGEDVAPALEQAGIFPPLAVRIFSVGQESGKLEEMLQRLSEDYDQQVASLSARLTSLLEPILIIVLAVVVGFVLLATILPILEAGSVL
jgi:type II secretory pathway component PulF